MSTVHIKYGWMVYTLICFAVLSSICSAQSYVMNAMGDATVSTAEHADLRGTFPRRGFSLQTEIPIYDPSETHFFAGGSIDTRLSYFDLTFGGDLGDKDVYVRIEYGMNLFYFLDEPDAKMSVSLGVAGIIGIHAEDWSNSRYEWLYQVPSFVVGLKHHFDRYSVTVGWKQNYALFGKMKDGKVIEEETLMRGAVYLKLCVY